MPAMLFGLYAPLVPLAGAPIDVGIAVEQFFPETAVRHANAIAAASDGGEVANDQDAFAVALCVGSS